MTDNEIGFAVLLGYFTAAVMAAVVAALKGRRAFGWFIATLIFPPLLLVLLLLPKSLDPQPPRQGTRSMPSWTQPPLSTPGMTPLDALKQAMNRAGFSIDSGTRKRIMSTFTSTANRRADPNRTGRQKVVQTTRPDTRPDRYPHGADEVEEVVARAEPVTVKAAIGRVGAVQRRGSRETKIFRRG